MLNIQVSTLVFQVLNFLVLLAVLRWFFYRPVLGVMKARQEAIAQKLRDADERARQAQAEREALSKQREEAQRKAQELVANAEAAASKAAQEIVDKARSEAAALLTDAKRVISEEKVAALSDTERQVRDAAANIAGSLIREAAGPIVHEQLLGRLLDTSSDSDALRAALTQCGGQITIHVAYPEPADQQRDIVQRLAHRAGMEPSSLAAQFQVQPSLLAGARLTAGDVVFDLSLRRTLKDLVGRRNLQEVAVP